jgi:hypothetical protein
MVADSDRPRPRTLHARLLLGCALSVLSALSISAQDRVVLLDRARVPLLPIELREFEITDGGRRWSLSRTTTLPPHFVGEPVVLADGSRILWLAFTDGIAFLVQYELATARASIVDVGPFRLPAVLVADPTALRVMIVEGQRVTFIDQRLQPYSVAIGPLWLGTRTIAVADGYVVVQRTVSSGAEAVVINSVTAEIIRTVSLPHTGSMRATRDAQWLYHASGGQIELRSLVTGQVLAWVTANGGDQLFELDESRGVLVHNATAPGNRPQIIGRDARSLAALGELGFGLYNGRFDFQLKAARNENAILVFSQGIASTGFDLCQERLPQIDVFDGTTLALLTQVRTSRCINLLVIPRR